MRSSLSESSYVPRVGYLGWHGYGNLGDEAIYDAVRSELAGARFVDIPRTPGEYIRGTLAGSTRALRGGAQVIGGGTLIGRRHWRLLIKMGERLTRDQQTYAIGVGVEDPAFGGKRSGSARGELARWPAVLSRFQNVSVRGPRSAELLADVGFDVAVTGDPALLLPRPKVTPVDGLIGVNLGFHDDLWGHDPDSVVHELSIAVKQLALQGYRFVGILMDGSDRRWTSRVLDGVDAELIAPQDSLAVSAELARCSLVIATRLHALILAALSDTPTISLEYQPKCRDFAMSINDERSLIRTDVLSSGEVVSRALDSLADSAGVRSMKRAAVQTLRQRLRNEFSRARRQIGLPPHSHATP
ncbi:polysaccharide pyruvyl transferase family protein [Mycobacterium sp. NPDC003323]